MTLLETILHYSPCCEQEREDRRMMLFYLAEHPNILLRSDETAHFTASGWVVNPDRSKVLMLHHNIYQSWSWPGGHADGEADLLSVALQEVRQETGLKDVRPVSQALYSLEILTVNAHFRRGKYIVPHLHLNLTYLLEADDAQPLHAKTDENSAVQWFPIEEAVSASSEANMRIVYAKLNQKLKDF